MIDWIRCPYLFVTPQNNFWIFLNGSRVSGGLGGVVDSTSCMVGKEFEDVNCVILAEEGMRTLNFLELVAEAALRSGILNQLPEVQKLDTVDIEGAIHAYYDIISQLCVVCGDLGQDKLCGRYNSLHSMPLDESLKIVRTYLIAATAKDLRMMFSFRSRETGVLESPYDDVFLESTS